MCVCLAAHQLQFTSVSMLPKLAGLFKVTLSNPFNFVYITLCVWSVSDLWLVSMLCGKLDIVCRRFVSDKLLAV